MVSRTPKPMMTRRSASELKNRRPKRNISPKNLDDSVSGLSWREERELKKALYASLQEARRQSRDDKPEDEESNTDSREGISLSQSRASLSSLGEPKYLDESSCSVDSSQSFTEKKETSTTETKKTKYHAQRKFAVNSFTPICPEPSSSESRATRYPRATHQKRIHAQRKFAQGSTPSTPVEMPTKPKLKASPVKLFPGRPKTEDFLTYLCFRGTSILPPHLDLMNVNNDEEVNGPVANGRSTRESSPASSSSMSHQNEDSMDVPDTPMRIQQTPSRKAARASASTPETARGFANLRRRRRNETASGSKLSPGSRKRLADSYGVGKKVKSPVKGHMGDRLSLKKKAMATLTAARRVSPKKQDGMKKMRATVSESDLHRRKDSGILDADQNNNKINKVLEGTYNPQIVVQKSNDNGNNENIIRDSHIAVNVKEFFEETGSKYLAEDSGIHVSFQDDKASPDSEKSRSFRTLQSHTKVEDITDILKSHVNITNQEKLEYHEEVENHEKLENLEKYGNHIKIENHEKIEILRKGEDHDPEPSNLHCTSLLKPLESDLDDSIDIIAETDISLNDSLDVNEIILNGSSTPGFLSPEMKRMKLSQDAKVQWNQDTHHQFKPAFKLTAGTQLHFEPKVIKLPKRKITTVVADVKSVRSLSDHSYHRLETHVRFQLKPKSKAIQTLVVSTPSMKEAENEKKDTDFKSVQTSIEITSLKKVENENIDTSSSIVQTLVKSTSSMKEAENEKKDTGLKNETKLDLTAVKQRKGNDLKQSPTKSNGTRKRRSDGECNSVNMSSPSKKSRVQNGHSINSVLKSRSKETRSHLKSKRRYQDSVETHPRKRLATTLRTKKTFKPHKPVTRATSHLKHALKAAKKAANKKLKLVSKALPSARKKEGLKPLKVEAKKKSPEKKKTSLDSASSKSSLMSQGSDNSGEIRIKTEKFPEGSDLAAMVQCPIYYPSEEQFRDPILYIQSIQSEAEQYGMCKIVPPCSWKMESREMEDFRFATQIQYIYKMLHKWSPITEQLEYIKRLHNDAGNDEFQVPQIGGVEIDLVKLYELVQRYGGMKGTVGKEKKWLKIADVMKVPKQADRVSKLYAAYCKYLLAYETLSEDETEKLQETVQADKQKLEAEKHIPSYHKCVYKGKSQPLTAFHRAARNTQHLYDPDSTNNPDTIEQDYWDIVDKSDDHVSVQGSSLDTSIYGSMFPVRRDNVYARHGWNLHNFVESRGSILHHLGLIAGVTVPALHIGMLYTTKCLSCNGHNLPTVQYLHQGPGLVWYAVPGQETDNLKKAMKKVAPKLVRNEGFCLQKNSVMVPPTTLVENDVSLSRCVQSEREFVVIFPSVNYSNISLGYNMSESVHYGTQDWIPEGYLASKYLGVNHDVELFSMDAMLVFLARDASTQDTTLALLLPYLEKVVEREITERKKLFDAGLRETERLLDKLEKPSPKCEVLEEIIICDVSNKICYLSMVLNSHENSAFSLEQGLLHIQKKKNLKHCKLMFRYSEEELKALVKEVKSRLRGGNSSSPITSSPKRKTRKSGSDIKISPASSTSSR